MFRDAVLAILASIAKQERVRLSERTLAGLERARAKGRVGGRPRIKREHDKDAKVIRQLREDGQSYREIAHQLSRKKTASPASAKRWCLFTSYSGIDTLRHAASVYLLRKPS